MPGKAVMSAGPIGPGGMARVAGGRGKRGDVVMTGTPKNPSEPAAADPLQPQQMAEDGIEDAESFANIQPDSADGFANIEPKD